MSTDGVDRVIIMANDIGNFFRAEPDRKAALEGISNHMNKFWTRKMRQKFLEYVQHGGQELDELPRAAAAFVTVAPAPQAAVANPKG